MAIILELGNVCTLKRCANALPVNCVKKFKHACSIKIEILRSGFFIGASSAQQAATPKSAANEQPSNIIVEVIGYGGAGNDVPDEEELRRWRANSQQ